MYEESRTIIELLYATCGKFPDKDFLCYKQEGGFKGISYTACLRMIQSLSASLYEMGIRKGEKIGIISDNLYKWLISDLSILSLGAVDVPRGSDCTADEISYILGHSEAKACFVENPQQAEKVLAVKEDLPALEFIVLFKGTPEETGQLDGKGIKLYSFEELVSAGEKALIQHERALKMLRGSITEDELATIIYTSGTTGTPKGVMLLHKNIMHNVHALCEIIPQTEKERWLSVLPVWHVLERTVEYCVLATGGSLGYSKPTAKHLIPDFAEIKPTFMVSVPRIWESVYNGILKKVGSGSFVAKGLFHFFLFIALSYNKAIKTLGGNDAYFAKTSFFLVMLKKLGALFTVIWLFLPRSLGDLIIFSKIRKRMGGCLHGPISGAGALAAHIDDFFAAIKIHILEGYGLTETSPVVSVRTFDRPVARTVGRPIPGVQVMIGDEDAKPLLNQHTKGIVYVKGDLVMAGYYKDPGKTMEVFKNGWFNTGDLGRLSLSGELQLLGRAKDTIVLSGGENVEPEHIENELLNDPLIQQVLVVGQDRKNLGALVIPNEELVLEFAASHNIQYDSYGALLKDKKVIAKIDEIIKKHICARNNFKSHERITCFALLEHEFKAGEEITHTLKIKRNVIYENYKKTIDFIYGRT